MPRVAARRILNVQQSERKFESHQSLGDVLICLTSATTRKATGDKNRFGFKAISFTVGFVGQKRPFSTEAQIELSYTVEKRLFRLNFFRLRIPTGGSSGKTRIFRVDPPVKKLSRRTRSKNSVEKAFHVFANRSHRSSHHQTHTHTATRECQAPHCSIIQGADAGVAITAVASGGKSVWRILSSARQQRVSHDGSSARYRFHAASIGCACCSFGSSRMSATPRT